MFSLVLLDLDDEQIDIVMHAVRAWCAAHGHDIDSNHGRSAMQMAISFALGGTRDPQAFAEGLERNLADADRPAS